MNRRFQCLALAALVSSTLLGAGLPAHAVRAEVAYEAAYADGDLVQADGDDKVYVVEGGRRRWLADDAAFGQARADVARLRRLPFEEIDRLPAGQPYHQLPLIRDPASGRVYLLVQEPRWPAPRRRRIADLDSFAGLGFDWSDVAPESGLPPDQYADAPPVTYRPVFREQTAFTTPQGTFWTAPVWRLQVEDDRLLMGLVLANTFNSEWRAQVAGGLAARGTWIEWGDLPDGTAGRLDPRLNRITVSRALEREPFGVLAAVLTHEVYHAVTSHGRDSAACLAEEVEAFTWEAKTWSNLPAEWRSRSQHGMHEDWLVQQWRAGGIEDYVNASRDYQRQCGAA